MNQYLRLLSSRATTASGLLTVACILLVGANVGFILEVRTFSSAAVLLALCSVSILTGSLAGFLLGMPRYVATRAETSGNPFDPSTSLEQISDWLTKILIGIGIAEAGKVFDLLDLAIREKIVPALSDAPSAYVASGTNIVSGTIIGFYISWLTTRLTLANALRRADSDVLREAANKVQDPELRENLLAQAADHTPEELPAVDASRYEELILEAVRRQARAMDMAIVPQFSARDFLSDLVLTRNDTRIYVQVKVGILTSIELNQLLALTGRSALQGFLLCSSRRIPTRLMREIASLNQDGYAIQAVQWSSSADDSLLLDRLRALWVSIDPLRPR